MGRSSIRIVAVTSAVEGEARPHDPQCGAVRTPSTIAQSARTPGIVRPRTNVPSQELRTLNGPPPAPLSDVRMPAENSDRERSQADAGPVLPLTERQLIVLVTVEQWIDGHGWPPSLSELCAELCIASKAVVREHLKALERKGYLRRDEGERRGLVVLVPSTRATVAEPRPIRKVVQLCARCRREVG